MNEYDNEILATFKVNINQNTKKNFNKQLLKFTLCIKENIFNWTAWIFCRISLKAKPCNIYLKMRVQSLTRTLADESMR